MKPLCKVILAPCLAALVLSSVHLAEAQPAKVYRVGVVFEGGPFYTVIDGLKDGLRELGFVEAKQYVLVIRDLKGDRNAAEGVSRSLERENVDVIYVVSTSVTTVVKRATSTVPIVFAVGVDPVVAGLIESFARPGGRLTGIHYLSDDVTAKRLEILKEILPGLRSVVTFYNPSNEFAVRAAKLAREAAQQLGVELVERRVSSVEEFRRSLNAFKAQDANAYFYTNDAMVSSQAQFIIDTARAKKLPTMFHEPSFVTQGALIGYGVSYNEVGRLSAKYVQRILTGTSAQNLPVESLSRLSLGVNLKTARELGLSIPQSFLFRADKVVE
jgi:putative ABC transport system substrate-binding protein